MQNSIKKTERVLRLFYRFFCEDAEGFLRPSRCAFPFDAGRYFPTSVRILLCRNKSRLNRNVLRLPSCFSSLRLKRRLFPRCYGYAISGYGIFPGPTPCFQAASGIGTTPQSGDVKTPVGVESKRKRGPIFANAIKQTAIVYLFGRAGLRIGWTSAEVCRDVPCRQSRDAHSIGAAVMKHR